MIEWIEKTKDKTRIAENISVFNHHDQDGGTEVKEEEEKNDLQEKEKKVETDAANCKVKEIHL